MIGVAAHGHINPHLPVLAELVARGHRVEVTTPPPFAAAVAATAVMRLGSQRPVAHAADHGDRGNANVIVRQIVVLAHHHKIDVVGEVRKKWLVFAHDG